MKLMSFRLTLPQLLLGMKSVTRRAGWHSLQDGALIQAVDQQMGLKPGQRPIRIAPLLVLSARREPLHAITDAEATLEGFPDKTGEEFARMFGGAVSSDDGMVTRIEFRPAAQDGIPTLGSRVNVYGRKRGLDGVVVGHVLPGDEPAPLANLVAASLMLGPRPGTGSWKPSEEIRAMVLKSDGKLAAYATRRMFEPSKTTTAADIVFEHTTSTKIRRMATAAKEQAQHPMCCLLQAGDAA